MTKENIERLLYAEYNLDWQTYRAEKLITFYSKCEEATPEMIQRAIKAHSALKETLDQIRAEINKRASE
jgi:hypothetical protein